MADNSNKYSIRRDALISPWGVGAIVPFPEDESLMVVGLDFWFRNGHTFNEDDEFIIIDERLSKHLGGKVFVSPPDFRTYKQDEKHADMKIPAVRFPLWHYCPVCGNMEKIGPSSDRRRCPGDNRRNSSKGTYCSINNAKGKKLPYMVPERFIAVCEDGHIEDFPIKEWVHAKSGKGITDRCKLYRSTGGSSASLSGIRYTCTCGASANMSGAFSRDTGHGSALDKIGYKCSGNQPWLGEKAERGCGKSLLVLQRGASNVWFADIVSSVYIPWLPKYKNQNTKDCINKGVKKFASSTNAGEIDVELIKKYVSAMKGIDEDIDSCQAVDEIIATLHNAGVENAVQTDDEYRKQEFDVLISTVGKPDNELYVKNYKASEYNNLHFLNSISLVHKLRETRVFTGFKRISPENTAANISIDNIPWLPAVKNSGEGIMFEFDYIALENWSKNPKVQSRVQIIENNLRGCGQIQQEKLNPIYILLHTFAHCLITALSNESGYSNASIREKIYCSKFSDDNAPQMAGILIYTASGDSEGSLGGLVRQGMSGRIEGVIQRVIHDAQWCAADPVCIQSPGQGQYGCNLAACHNCALLPETSCENKNMLLDRGLLIGTLDDNTIGYFFDYEKN